MKFSYPGMDKRLMYNHNTDIRYTAYYMLTKSSMCILCGRPISGKGIIEKINGMEYVFDREECALTFKKLKSVYGDEFCINTC